MTDDDAYPPHVTSNLVGGLTPAVNTELLQQLTQLEIRASEVLNDHALQSSSEASSSEVARAIRVAVRDSEWEVHRRNTLLRRWVFALVLLILATAVSVIVVTLSADHSGAEYSSVLAPATALLGSIAGFYFGTSAGDRSKDQDDRGNAQLLDAVTRLERQIWMAVAKTRSVRSDETLSTLVQDLLERGVWREQDAQDFRTVMGARNLVVHSGGNSDRLLVRTQTQLAQRLSQALTTQGSPGDI